MWPVSQLYFTGFYLLGFYTLSLLWRERGGWEGKQGRGNEKKERNSFGMYDAKVALRYTSQNMAFFGFEPVQYYYWPQLMEFQSVLENTVIDVPCVF